MNSVVNLLCCGTRLHHHGCDIQDFSSQLQTTRQNEDRGWKTFTNSMYPYLANDPHSFDVIGRQGLDLRRPL